MTRDQRARVRTTARKEIVRQHHARYLELYRHHLGTGINRTSAQSRAQADLADEFRTEYERIYSAAVEKEQQAASALEKALQDGLPDEMVSEDFKHHLGRRCNPEYGKAALFVSDNRAERSEAKGLCRVCPVRQACEDWANVNDEQYHVWGGVDRSSAAQRRTSQRRFQARVRQLVPA